MCKLLSSLPPARVEGGSEPQLHPPFPDENSVSSASSANFDNSGEFILDQPCLILGTFSRKLSYQKLDFADPRHTFASPVMSSKSRKSDGVKS